MSIAPTPPRTRPLVLKDVEEAGDILYQAFGAVYAERGFRPPFPSPEAGAWLARAYLDLDPQGAVVAERGLRLSGVGFVHVRGAVASIGPVASRPGAPDGTGRAIMEALLAIAERAGARTQRLFQDSFNPRSFALYSKLGFEPREVVAYGVCDTTALRRAPAPRPGISLRELDAGDLDELGRFDVALSGGDRRGDFELILRSGGGFALFADGRMRAFLLYREGASRVALAPAAAAHDPADLVTLVAHAASRFADRALSARLPAAPSALLTPLLEMGFAIDHLGNLMVRGPELRQGWHLHSMFPESL
jgi:GNAT superfamily N-acetyltransferase